MACLAAKAVLLKKQNPSNAFDSAWCPGGRMTANMAFSIHMAD